MGRTSHVWGALVGLLLGCVLCPGCDEEAERTQELKSLLPDLMRSDRDARWRAVVRLGRLGDARAVEPLIACLKDTDRQVRQVAAKALLRLEDARAAEPLINSVEGLNNELHLPVVKFVASLGDARAVKPLIASLKRTHAGCRQLAVETLGKLGDSRAVEPLIACLADKEPSVREYAAVGLSRLGDARAIEPLRACLADQHWDPRGAAAGALWCFLSSRVAIVNEQKGRHPWHESIPKCVQVPSLKEADILLVVGDQNEKVISMHHYTFQGGSAPSITRYQCDLEVTLLDARTGTKIEGQRFCNFPERAPETAPLSQTRIGEPVSFLQVEVWLLPRLFWLAQLAEEGRIGKNRKR